MTTQMYRIQGMDCANCAKNIEKGVAHLEGVQQAQVDFATGKMKLMGDVPLSTLQARIAALGYTLIPPDEAPETKQAPGGLIGFWQYLASRPETRLALVGGGLVIVSLLATLLGLPSLATNLMLIVAMALAAYPIARSGLNNLFINRDFNINLLMTIAAVGATLIGEYLESATVIFLFAVGEALEGYTADRARNSIRSLMELAPPHAIRLRAGHEEIVPVEQLVVGDTILVKPGERLAMDGIVIAGTSTVNQAPITGESMPVLKAPENEVFAGSINGMGALEVRVTHLAADNTISRIIRLVEEAQSVRAPSQRLIDQIARWYTPLVVVMAILVAAIPPLAFGEPFWDTADGTHGWLYRALSLLVIACPCALVISAPVAIISAITAGARQGVLIKGGAHLEALATIRALAFDKTGTLTRGEPIVVDSMTDDCAEPMDKDACNACDDVLALAAAVERRSTHPLARAVLAAAQKRGVTDTYAPAEQVEVMAGQGVQGRVDSRLITIGSHRLFDEHYQHTQNLHERANQAEAQGQTTVLLRDDQNVRGFIAFSDAVRPESQQAVEELKKLGTTTIMLTGDHNVVAQVVGQQVGVDEIRADMLPEEKATAVKNLLATYQRVAMVGDGVNDAPALATATVGVAMGGVGSAQALETADVVLMSDDLRQLPLVIRLARFTRRLILQNVVLSLGIKAVFLLLALSGVASLWMAILADVGMSLLVTLNGMRPLRAFIQRQPQR